jgi:subtilisin family serine protease
MSTLMQSLIDRLYKKGIVMVAAAGNEATNIPYYPAAYGRVISVAAVDSNEIVWADSNYSPYTELAAPGVSIISTGVDFSTTIATDILQDDDSSNTNYNQNVIYTYSVFSGTRYVVYRLIVFRLSLSTFFTNHNVRFCLLVWRHHMWPVGSLYC